MSQVDIPYAIPLSALSINDLIILNKRDQEADPARWSLVFYAAEDYLIEASYRSSESLQEEYVLKTSNTLRAVNGWKEEVQGYKEAILLRIPTYDIGDTVDVVKNAVERSGGALVDSPEDTGKVSVKRVVLSLANETKLLRCTDHSRLLEVMDGLKLGGGSKGLLLLPWLMGIDPI